MSSNASERRGRRFLLTYFFFVSMVTHYVKKCPVMLLKDVVDDVGDHQGGATGGRASTRGGWSGGAMVLGKLPVPGRPTIWISVGQGPTALAVGAGGDCLDIFTLHLSFLSSFSLSLGDGPI